MAVREIAASSPDARRRMRSQARRDTAPEIALRRLLHGAGLRYRVDYRLPGFRSRPDIAFVRERVAVFMDGCFWHSCPQHSTVPVRNREWWQGKLGGNVRRDQSTTEQLTRLGWRVIRVWEHEDPRDAARQVEMAVRARRSGNAANA